MVPAARPRWLIDQVETDDGVRWTWRCVSPDGGLVGSCPLRFKTFLDAYADAKNNGMDTHDFVPSGSQRSV
jgi:hypothetical protein